MQYCVAHFAFRFAEDWQADVFTQALFDMGFDTMDGEDAYIPAAIFRTCQVPFQQLLAETEGVQLISVEECPDGNWNAVWEAEHPIEQLPLGIQIVPHCAFGAGHHETTGMMINALLHTDLSHQVVLDNGCGTGILAIYAAKRGAERVVAVDIDEKSVHSAKENAIRNQVEIEVVQGSTPPPCADRPYDLIMANIHRNILLQQMPLYAQLLRKGGELWLSGFYAEDCQQIIEHGKAHGLIHTNTNSTPSVFRQQESNGITHSPIHAHTDERSDAQSTWCMLTMIKA